MDAKTKKKLIIAGGIGLVAILLFRNRGEAETVIPLPVPSNGVLNGDNLMANPPEFKYAGGGINMFMDGNRITWPAMQTLMPVSVGGSNYRTGDMASINTFTGDFNNVTNNPLNRDCCCDDPADPTQTVSAAIIVATTKEPPKRWNGYEWQRPGQAGRPMWTM